MSPTRRASGSPRSSGSGTRARNGKAPSSTAGGWTSACTACWPRIPGISGGPYSVAREMSARQKVHPGTKIGHVHLKVSDLERAERFYTDVLGFEVQTRYGSEASFLSYGGYHHHLGLNTWMSKGGPPSPPGSAGLFRF